jgi:hypothetical protein
MGLPEDAEVRINKDGHDRLNDNIFVERLWRTVKYEEVYLHDYRRSRKRGNVRSPLFGYTARNDCMRRSAIGCRMRSSMGHQSSLRS